MVSRIALAAGVVSWLVAVVSWGLAVKNRVEGQSLASHLVNGIKAFDPNNFTEVGQRHQTRMFYAFGMVALCFLGAAVGVAIESGTP